MFGTPLTVVKEFYGTVYTVFIAPEVLVSSNYMLLSILSKSRRCDHSTCLQCTSRMDCTDRMAKPPAVLPSFRGKWIKSCYEVSGLLTLLHPVAWTKARLLMPPWNHCHWVWSTYNWEVLRIELYWISISTEGLGNTEFFGLKQWIIPYTFLQNALSFARRSSRWQCFGATDVNGFSDRHCGIACSRNWVTEMRLKKFVTYSY